MKERKVVASVLLALLFGCFGAAQLRAEDKTLPKQSKKFKLHAVRIEYKNSTMTNPKRIRRANQSPGVVTGDSLDFAAALDPAFVLANSSYSWSGVASAQGPQVSVTFNTPGSSLLTLNVFDENANENKAFTATTRVRFVGPEKETDICPTPEAVFCLAALADASLAVSWATIGGMAEALGFPAGPCTSDDGKCNAAKHSYWNILMVRDTNAAFAARLATAHERFSDGYIFTGQSGIDAGSAHNSVVMDLENNAAGRGLATGLTPFSSSLPLGDEPGKAAAANAVISGSLTKLDTSSNLANTNPEGSGLLEPTSQ